MLAIEEEREEDALMHKDQEMGHRMNALRHLDDAIQIGRNPGELDRSDSEVVAEIGLCLTWRIDLDPGNSERTQRNKDMKSYLISQVLFDGQENIQASAKDAKPSLQVGSTGF